MKTGGNFHEDLKRDLKNPKFAFLFEREKKKLEMQAQLNKVFSQSKLSIRSLASKMGTSKSQVQRLISDSDANIELDTLIRFATAVGKKLEIELR